MNILITVNAAWNVWNFRRPLVEALLADGHSVTVLAPLDEAASKLESIGCRVIHLPMSVKGLNPIEDVRLIFRFWRTLGDLRPHAVLSFTIKNNIFGAAAARLRGIPLVPNVTGLGTAFLSGGLLERVAVTLYKSAFRRVPIVFFQNEDDRNLFLDRSLVRQDQTRLLPGSGVDLSRFSIMPLPPDNDAPVFLMIARLLRDKGILEYVDAAREVKKLHPAARFQILGPMDSLNRTAIDRPTVQRWEEEGVVEYLGTTDDVRQFIASADCVVLPSYREGAPRTLLEAAAMGRPCIATDVPGCNAAVEDGVTGFLCEVRNAGSLMSAFKKFIAMDARTRAQMGQAGRARMERVYDQRIVVEAYRSAIAQLNNEGAQGSMVGHLIDQDITQ